MYRQQCLPVRGSASGSVHVVRLLVTFFGEGNKRQRLRVIRRACARPPQGSQRSIEHERGPCCKGTERLARGSVQRWTCAASLMSRTGMADPVVSSMHPTGGAEHYPSTAKVWQTLNIGKSSKIPNNLIISGVVHGQMP